MLLEDFEIHLKTKFPEVFSSRLLLAVSGGMDSVVLGSLLHQLNLDFSVAHCNFKLRGVESDLDEELVRTLAGQWKVKYYSKSFETKKFAEKNKLSTQMAARELRYKWFEEIIQNEKLDILLTAHHADDNIETFFINLFRGSGIDGLTGIPEKNQNTIRPLLQFSRKEIENFASENGLIWREDKSNQETLYERNKIRLELIPQLQKINPDALKGILKSLENLNQSKEILEEQLEELLPKLSSIDAKGNTVFDLEKINQMKNPNNYLFAFLKNFGFKEWQNVYDLRSAQSGKKIYSSSHFLLKNRNDLILGKLEKPIENSVIKIEEPLDFIDLGCGKIRFQSISKSENTDIFKTKNNEILIDKKKLKYPIFVRKWENGDYFYPFGMKGSKKISKFLKELKLSLIEKENIWLLCSQNKVVWVIGKRLDDRFKVSPKTPDILKIVFEDE